MKAQSQVILWKLTLRRSSADDCWRKLYLLLVLEYWKVFLVLLDWRAAIHYIHLLLWRKKCNSTVNARWSLLRSAKWKMNAISSSQLKSNSVSHKVSWNSQYIPLKQNKMKEKNPPYKWGLGSKIRPSKPVSTTI